MGLNVGFCPYGGTFWASLEVIFTIFPWLFIYCMLLKVFVPIGNHWSLWSLIEPFYWKKFRGDWWIYLFYPGLR